MKLIAQYIAMAALMVLIVPPMAYLAGRMTLDATKTAMLIATIVWFIAATAWMWPENNNNA